jgi:hypothetical protein
MQLVERFALDGVDEQTHRSGLAKDGRQLRGKFQGLVLEKQFELPDGSFLLWLTEATPYEEGLHVYLVDDDGEVEDAVEAGAGFAAGILHILQIGPDWVDFEFFMNRNHYRLHVAESAIRLFLPAGWKYKNLLSRHRLFIELLEGAEA